MKNKNGFLLAEQTLKIIIALISISFLIYFLTALYFTNQSSRNLEFAKATLKHLVNGINSGDKEIIIYNPKDWVIASWPHDVKKSRIFYNDVIKGDTPQFCLDNGWNKCICICKDNLIFNLEGKDCDNNGICLKSEYTLNGGIIKIKNLPLTLQINYKSKEITEK